MKGVNMNTEFITNLISNIGFPIAVCVMMFSYIKQQQTYQQKEMSKSNEILTKLQEQIISNTEVMRDLQTQITHSTELIIKLKERVG